MVVPSSEPHPVLDDAENGRKQAHDEPEDHDNEPERDNGNDQGGYRVDNVNECIDYVGQG